MSTSALPLLPTVLRRRRSWWRWLKPTRDKWIMVHYINIYSQKQETIAIPQPTFVYNIYYPVWIFTEWWDMCFWVLTMLPLSGPFSMGSQMGPPLEVLVSAFSSWAIFSSGSFSLLATSFSLVTTSACLVFLSRFGSKCNEDQDTVAPTTWYKCS